MNAYEISAMAVHAHDDAVMIHVESREFTFAYTRLETVVPRQTVMEMKPAYDTGTPRSEYIIGHAAPSIESGRPREMNAR